MIQSKRKGIILAGGNGSRLYPITKAISKQLMPIYDKPMIYYPLTTLMLAGIREILVITSPKAQQSFQSLLGNGSNLGISIKYKEQFQPDGLAQALILGEDFIDNSPSALILGDNLFHGDNLAKCLQSTSKKIDRSTIFAYHVNDPERYGIVEFDKKMKAINIEEKPRIAKSKYAVTGLYFYDKTASERSKELMPSSRGELEITDLNNQYLKDSKLHVEIFDRGMAWLDTGTPQSLQEACNYISTIENRQGLKIGCPEEVAWRMGWINDNQIENIAFNLRKTSYGKYLQTIFSDHKS